MVHPALTVQTCMDELALALGNVTPGTALSIVREAREHWDTACEWSWNVRGPVTLQGRAPVAEVAAVAWTQTGKTLVKAGAFTSYEHLAGDRVTITAGTGLTLRKSRIVSKDSANQITIEDDIGPDAADAALRIDIESIALPADWDHPLEVASSDGLNDSFRFTTRKQLLDAMTSGTPIVDFGYVAAALWQDAVGGGNPVRVLGIFPKLSTGKVDLFTCFYRRLPSDLNLVTDTIDIPPHAHGLFLRFVREVGLGRYRENQANVEERIDAVVESRLFQSLVERDGVSQPDWGELTGGMVETDSVWVDWTHGSVENPT